MSSSTKTFFETNVLGHPAGLFVLFFTEMWERFSYYGMRAILVLFLTRSLTEDNPGWGWSRENALSLLGTYVFMVYLTPILGGYLADKKLGYRLCVFIGALVMTFGHASMAVETPLFLYIGITLLIIGNGFFKPNIMSIISEMYKDYPEKKDGAYTIFYMGVNSGAFLGIMLCGYLGEKVGWGWGFGLAGIFMFFGMLQFWFAEALFGDIGKKPTQSENQVVEIEEGDRLNPFSFIDKLLIVLFSIISVVWILNDPLSKIGNIDIIPGGADGDWANGFIIFALLCFLVLIVMRIMRYTKVVRDRMIAVSIFAFLTIFFWAAFEQAAGTLPIFAADYTQRNLIGNTAVIFKIIDTIVTIVPIVIITWVLYLLIKKTYSMISLSNVILSFSFLMIWEIVIYKLYHDFSDPTSEVPATWFGILNSLFIIIFAPAFSKIWESKYNPPAAFKYGFGLILLGIGFLFLVVGTSSIPQGAKYASVSMIWLIIAYLFHTLGELCLAPLGLSYLSKLVPTRMIAFMFGVWLLAIAIGNKLAHTVGGQIDKIVEEYSLSFFFGIFAVVPICAGVLAMLLHPLLKKLMHGVE